MPRTYEWLIEELDGEDIIDVNHTATLHEARALAYHLNNFQIALVCDTDDDRGWAYFINGRLDSHIRDAYDRPMWLVPGRYRIEVAAQTPLGN